MLDLVNTLQGIFNQSHGTGILLIAGILAIYCIYRICQRLSQNGGNCKAGIFSITVIVVVCMSLMTLVLLHGGIPSSSQIPRKIPNELQAHEKGEQAP